MSPIDVILRYTAEQLSVVYAPESNFPDRQELQQFIKDCLAQDTVSLSFTRIYQTTAGQVLSLAFFAEQDTVAPSWLIVLQQTEQQPLDIHDMEAFAGRLKLFFRKGAHDMKNLLSNLSLLLRAQSVEKARHYLSQVEKQYMAKLEEFYQALDMAVAAEKPADLQVKPVYFSPLVAQILAPYRLPAEDFSLETDFQSCDKINYREDHLHSMLKSLIDNAIRYRAADRKLRIRMYTECTEEHEVIFFLEDNGIGINMQQHQHKLFMPFQRFTQQGNGQGISLHLVRLMVEKNGGSIQLYSTLHEGTKVKLLLKACT